MDLKDIPLLRLANQHISLKKYKSVEEIVGYLGAVQAQDFPMSKWAIGIRSYGLKSEEIDSALNNGLIFRTHILRPTWHLVARDDIRWMLDLTTPSIKSAVKTRHKQLGLTDTIIQNIYRMLEKKLANGNHLTREELVIMFKNAGIPLGDNMAAHILLSAEIDKVICNGIIKNDKHTYALFDERVPFSNPMTREEALEKLARNYFTSRAPATLKDFTWWSGLGMNDANKAFRLLTNDFISVKVESESLILPKVLPSVAPDKNIPYFLPAYDEYLISYKDRTAMITSAVQKDIISKNGIFRPIIVVNGQVAGIWKKSVIKNRQVIELQHFNPLKKLQTGAISKARMEIETFFGRTSKGMDPMG